MRKCCLSAATACLCLQSHYNTKAICVHIIHMCVRVCHTDVSHNNQMLSWGHCPDESHDALLLDPLVRPSGTQLEKVCKNKLLQNDKVTNVYLFS